jgi:hypothetical protein
MNWEEDMATIERAFKGIGDVLSLQWRKKFHSSGRGRRLNTQVLINGHRWSAGYVFHPKVPREQNLY